MVTGSLARRYAKALLEIGIKQNNFDALGKELDRAADTLRHSPELPPLPETPKVPEVPKAPELPPLPETPKAPELPPLPETPKAPEQPK